MRVRNRFILEANHRRARRGFTLIEAALTTVIIGVGVMSMMQLLAAGTASNLGSAELTTGINLAKNIREIAIQKSVTELMAMNGTSHVPPYDSSSKSITDLPGWKQEIVVQSVNPDRLTTVFLDPAPSAVQVLVTVSHNGRSVCTASWFTFDGTPAP